jgi:hypothetical protein
MRQKRFHQKPKEILEFWRKALATKYGKDIYLSSYRVDEHVCFACGYPSGTQRCHIIPKCNGGADDIFNIHLLCRECHLESEFIETQNAYFEWLISKNAFNSGSFLKMQNKALLYLKFYKNGERSSIPSEILSYFDLVNVGSIVNNVIEDIENKGIQKVSKEYFAM